ncbi:MAG: type II toxin-antitoxin system RelE/ParE family toxin [Cyclobacteriaceae bacterium]
MYSIEKTELFDKWLRKLKDQRAKAKILFRIQRVEEHGNFGDCEPVGLGISELRIHYAKGYRIYLKEYRGRIILLLNGGDKSSQQKDIEKAKEVWSTYKDELEDGN